MKKRAWAYTVFEEDFGSGITGGVTRQLDEDNYYWYVKNNGEIVFDGVCGSESQAILEVDSVMSRYFEPRKAMKKKANYEIVETVELDDCEIDFCSDGFWRIFPCITIAQSVPYGMSGATFYDVEVADEPLNDEIFNSKEEALLYWDKWVREHEELMDEMDEEYDYEHHTPFTDEDWKSPLLSTVFGNRKAMKKNASTGITLGEFLYCLCGDCHIRVTTLAVEPIWDGNYTDCPEEYLDFEVYRVWCGSDGLTISLDAIFM